MYFRNFLLLLNFLGALLTSTYLLSFSRTLSIAIYLLLPFLISSASLSRSCMSPSTSTNLVMGISSPSSSQKM